MHIGNGDRKRAESVMLSADHDLSSIINTIPMTAWSTRADGYCDFVNQRWLDYAGLEADQVRGWGWEAVIHPDDLNGLLERWRSCLASGAPVNAEARMRRFDGVYRWFLFLGNPLRDEAGNIVKWFGTNVDIEDRKRAEHAQQASERDLIQIINTIPTTAWSTLPDGFCDFLSDRWLDYAGFTLEQARGWSWAAAIHPDDADRLREYWLACLASGTPVDTEARIRRFDGVYRWFLFRANPLRDEAGDIIKWYGTNVDIEDRKGADQALLANERNLSQIINTIPALAWSASPDGSADFFNQHYLDYVGFSLEQAKEGWTDAVHPDDLPGLMNAWHRMMATSQPGECEARLRRFDGEYRWFLFRTNPLRDESGNTVKWYGTNTDIDDRKRAEEKLRRSEEFLAKGQRLSITGSFSWLTDSDEIAFSEELRRIFTFEPDEPVTLERIGSRIYPEDLPLWSKKIDQARAGGNELDYEIRLRMPDDSIKYVHTMAYGTHDRDGRLEIIGAVQDITERRLADEALGKVRSELARVARLTSLGALTASIAHEINQPLSAIITNSGTCLRMLGADSPDIDDARDIAQHIVRDGKRASEVISRLRSLFVKKSSASELVDLNEAAREVISLSWSDLQANRVLLRDELEADIPHVVGDRVQLQQVMLNLLLNASDAMRDIDDRPREIVIKSHRDEADRVRLTVRDAGAGIEPEVADKLFEAFYTTKNGGMGVGLSVSRSIIESLHGQIWASSNDDGPGAAFSFSIPCQPDRPAPLDT